MIKLVLDSSTIDRWCRLFLSSAELIYQFRDQATNDQWKEAIGNSHTVANLTGIILESHRFGEDAESREAQRELTSFRNRALKVMNGFDRAANERPDMVATIKAAKDLLPDPTPVKTTTQGGKRIPLTEQEKTRICELFIDEHSINEICELTGRSWITVNNVVVAAGLKPEK